MENTRHDATGSVAPGATNRQHNKKWEKWEEEGTINSPPPSIYAISTVFCEAHGTPVHMCDGQYPRRPPPTMVSSEQDNLPEQDFLNKFFCRMKKRASTGTRTRNYSHPKGVSYP